MLKTPICNICGKLPAETKTKRLVIDHNHTTNIIRGWLCDFCNTKLGVFESKKDCSPIIVNERYKESYRTWLACYISRIYEHLKSNTHIYYDKRKKYRKQYSTAFA